MPAASANLPPEAPDLDAVLDSVLDGVVVTDLAGRVQRLNSEACRLLETSSEKACGRALGDLVGHEHPIAQLARQVQHDARPAVADDVPLARRFGGGAPFLLDVAISPLAGGDDPSGTVIAIRDHTVRQAMRDSEEQRETLTSYGHIAAGIAHEVKNPLGGIRGAAELILGWSENERAQRAAEMITREVDRITALVDELMVFARGDALELEETNLHRVLDEVLELVGADPIAAGIGIERLYDPSIPELEIDPARLKQVFLNLARNAFQALAASETAGPRLQITTRMALGSRLTDANGRAIPTVVVQVADNGPGIPADVLGKLTTPFYTTRTDGTGLGLSVARHWVDRLGGTLRFESELGTGTEVKVALPLRRRTDEGLDGSTRDDG